MNSEQGAAADYVVISVNRKEFQRGCNIWKFLNFIEENKGFVFDKSCIRIDTRNIFDNGFGSR